MNMKKPYCPRCGNPLSQEQFLATMVVCKCGWHMQMSAATTQAAVERRHALSLIFWVMLLAGVVFHFFVWDTYSIDIIVPKLKHYAKKATVEDYKLITKICEKREKMACQIEALEAIVKLDPENDDAVVKLGKTYRDFKEDQKALSLYESYFASGGKNIAAAVSYAELTGEIGDVATSRFYFRKALDARPNIFQATVTRSYVNMLLANHQYKMASEAIRYYRGKSVNAKYFMQKELAEIQRNLASGAF